MGFHLAEFVGLAVRPRMGQLGCDIPIAIQYPHNILLEIWFEAGVVGLVAFLAAIWIAVGNQGRIFKHDLFRGTLAMGGLLYWLAAVMVSGHVNDNKVLALALVASAASLAPSTSDDDPVLPADAATTSRPLST